MSGHVVAETLIEQSSILLLITLYSTDYYVIIPQACCILQLMKYIVKLQSKGQCSLFVMSLFTLNILTLQEQQ